MINDKGDKMITHIKPIAQIKLMLIMRYRQKGKKLPIWINTPTLTATARG